MSASAPLLRRRGVDHVQDQVGEHGLLERRLERLDQLVGQLLDEADRVGQQVAAAGELEAAGGRVEGVEEPVPHPDLGAGERVQQGRLAGVGVAGERDARERGALAAGAHHAAVALQPRQAAAQRRDPVAGEAAVGLDLGLARAPGADPAPEPLEVGPQAPHPRQVVLELGQLDLELALGRVGVVGEDVEDDRGAVDHRHAQRRLEVALLARRQLVVAGDEVGVAGGDLLLQLGELAAAEVAVGVGRGALLDRLAGGRDARRCAAAPSARRAGRRRSRAVGDADRQRPLARPRVRDAGAVRRRSGSACCGRFSNVALRPIVGGRRLAPSRGYRLGAVKVFVTGGTGFIGGEVVRQLRERGDEVVCLVRSPEKGEAARRPRLRARRRRPRRHRGDPRGHGGLRRRHPRRGDV